MGDKITAKNAVAAFDVPVVPGVAKPGLTDDELVAAADEVGYPVLIKPSAGGGGKGMRLVEDPARLREALVSARREAASVVRRRHAVPGAVRVAAQAHRGPGARRHARQRGASRRARVQPAAAPPEGHRGGALAAARRRRHARGSGRRPATPPAASITSAPARWSSSSPPTVPTSSSSWR